MTKATSSATLGVALITKNAQADIEKCLSRIHGWVDQIVIVDSGSTDQTEAIARRFTDEFYSHTDWPGFGKQRQLAHSYIKTDWILYLDADELITPELQHSIEEVLATNPKKCCYRINRLTFAFGKAIHHSGCNPDWVIRLCRRDDAHYNNALVHEKLIIPDGFKIKSLKGRMEHLTCRSITQYIQKTQGYMKAWTDQREGCKKSSLGKAIAHSFFRFIRMYILKLGFLDGRHGLLLSMLSAYTVFVRYCDLWLRHEMKQQPQDPHS